MILYNVYCTYIFILINYFHTRYTEFGLIKISNIIAIRTHLNTYLILFYEVNIHIYNIIQ